MSNKSAKEYISSNDFEGAKARFDKSYKQWKQHWFDTCYAIAQKVKTWATKYIFDPINLTITAIAEKVKKVISKKNTESHVYLIKMFDENGSYRYLKAGKANVLKDRFNQLNDKLYKQPEVVQISRLEILKTWVLPNEKLAEAFENIIHSYLGSIFTHVPKDRYHPIEVTADHIAEIDRKYELMTAFF